MRTLVTTALIVALAVPAGAAGPVSGPPSTTIQPGMLITEADGSPHCTGGFIYNGSGRLRGKIYLSLAAHCVEDNVGAPVYDAQGKRLGVTAYSSWPYKAFDDDFAFVELDRSVWSRVSPGLAGHPDLPRSAPNGENISIGDVAQLSGWGLGADSSTATRQERVGPLTTYEPGGTFGADAYAGPGDSGGPVADKTTGAAVGSVSNLCAPLPFNYGVNPPGCTVYGPSVANILRLAAKRGFPVRLRTVAEGTPH